jgi:hypothetical protein
MSNNNPSRRRKRRDPKPYFQAGHRRRCLAQPPGVQSQTAHRRNDLRHPCHRLGRRLEVALVGCAPRGIFIFHPDGHGEWAFHPDRLPPVMERPTDITIFKGWHGGRTIAICRDLILRLGEFQEAAT